MSGLQFLKKGILIKVKKSIKFVRLWHFNVLLLILNLVLIFTSIYFLNLINRNLLFPLSTKDIKVASYPYLSKKPNLQVSGASYVVYDKDSRVVVAALNENLRFSPASTAKIMTALIALDKWGKDEVLTAGGLSYVEGSKMGLFEGERIKVLDLLYGLLLPSGNDAAYVLSQSFEGGGKKFLKEMNKKAGELKLFNTHFSDPAGYNEDNYTTAFDLARLGTYALEDENLREIVKTKGKIVYDSAFSHSHKLKNLNELLYDPNITGIKTGFTEDAGGVLVASFVRDGKTFIIVVLKSKDRFGDTRELIREVVEKVNLMSY